MKNVFISSFLVLLMMASSWGQDSIFIDITIRDFSSYHPDFENFNSKVTNPTDADCGFTGQSQLADQAFKDSFLSQLRADFPGRYAWADANSRDIYPTFGMVNSTLSNGIPTKARDACNNSNFEQWFTDVPGTNYRVDDVIGLALQSGNVYQVKYSYWDSPRNSFFPLDKHASANVGDAQSPIDPSVQTWGKQNLDGWCNGEQAGCQTTADGNGSTPNSLGSNANAHNYGYTVQGTLEFAYRATGDEVFTFQGDDDMWIFIDDQLVVDLGGTHLPVSRTINLDDIAAQFGWSPNTTHRMDFFYAERQTDAANLTLTVTLNDIVPSKNRSPYITRTEKIEGSATYNLFMNVELSDETINNINNGVYTDFFSIRNALEEEIGGLYDIATIKAVESTSDERKYGVKYEITFNTDPSLNGAVGPETGNTISFNMNSPTQIIGSNGLPVDKFSYVEIVGIQASTTGNATVEDLEGVYEKKPIDNAVIEAKYGDGKLDENEGVDLNIVQHTEGIPLYYKEVIVAELPKGGSINASNAKNFSSSDGSNICTPETCIDDLGFWVKGPFIANFSIFDHFGQFIRKYQQVVTQEQINEVYGDSLKTLNDGSQAVAQPYIYVKPSIVPIDQFGRQLGTTPLVIQMDLIELPPEICFIKDAANNVDCEPKSFQPNRTIETYRIGYRRFGVNEIVLP